MRIRKRQHPIAHGIAFLLIGGASAPVSAGMMGAKAHRNKLADEEAERLAGWLAGWSAGWLAGGSPLVRAQNDAAQQIIDHERAVQAARELLAAEEASLAAEEASLAAEEASWSTVTGTLVSWGKKAGLSTPNCGWRVARWWSSPGRCRRPAPPRMRCAGRASPSASAWSPPQPGARSLQWRLGRAMTTSWDYRAEAVPQLSWAALRR